jgi:DNA-binding beta-propeller fold protein YncE
MFWCSFPLFAVLFSCIPVNAFQSRGFSTQERPTEKCIGVPSEGIVNVPLPGQPFGIATTGDSCWVFVALTDLGGIAVLRHEEGTVHLRRIVPVGSSPTKMVITHDGRLLIVANSDSIVFLDVHRMVTGASNPVEGDMPDGGSGIINVNVTADDRFLFVSDEGSETITVINLQEARHSAFSSTAIIGKIPVGIAPIALVVSPDQRFLYTTSEIDFGFSIECMQEGQAGGPQINPPGAVIVVDVARAELDPANSVVTHVPAGCSPVRLVLSADGERAYVTARGSDSLLVFSAARLVLDPSRSLVATVPTGPAPVGVATIDHDEMVVVANSNRFSSNQPETLTVIRASRVASGVDAILGTIPAGLFPREVQLSPDGRTLYVSNFDSKTLELINAKRLPLNPVPKPKDMD